MKRSSNNSWMQCGQNRIITRLVIAYGDSRWKKRILRSKPKPLARPKDMVVAIGNYGKEHFPLLDVSADYGDWH